jgi:hypothetical protein
MRLHGGTIGFSPINAIWSEQKQSSFRLGKADLRRLGKALVGPREKARCVPMNKHFNQMKNPRLQPPHQLLPSASSFCLSSPCHRRSLFFLDEHQLCLCVHKANSHSFLQPIQAQIPTTLLLATASTSQSLFSKFPCINTFTKSSYCTANPSAVYKHVVSH